MLKKIKMTTKEGQRKKISDISPKMLPLPPELQEVFGKPTFTDPEEFLGDMAAFMPKFHELDPELQKLFAGYLEATLLSLKSKPQS